MAWTTQYASIHRSTPRGVARSATLDVLALAGEATGQTQRALARPRVHFIYLHHIFQDELEPFRQLLASLTKVMMPISYSDAVQRTLHGPIDRPYLAISFDDGFKNCLDAAAVLDEFAAKACFFVCPKIVDARDDDELIRFARGSLHMPPVQFMNWTDLDGLLSRGHEIGNHTLGHEPLFAAADARAEIEKGLSLLRLRYGNVRHFAWPYGNFDSVNSENVRDVFATGHSTCASGVRGAHVTPAKDERSLCIRRDHVIAAWPLRQVRYLLAKSAARATATDNEWPDHLR